MKNSNGNNSQNAKRVAVFSVHSDPLAKIGGRESGGQNIYVHELSRWLGKLGWTVDVYTRWTNKKEKPLKKISPRANLIRLKAGDIKFVPKEQFDKNFEEFFTNFLSYKHANKINYDIIHGNYWDGGWVGMQAAEILKIPFIQTFHSLGYIRTNTLKKFQNLPTQVEQELNDQRFELEKKIVEKADKVIAESPYEEDDLMRFYGASNGKICICPAGVDINKFKLRDRGKARDKLKIDRNARVLLYAGRLEWRKGLGTLIMAASSVIKNDLLNQYLVIIVGGDLKNKKDGRDQAEYSRLLNIAKEQGIADNLRFAGAVPQRQITYYYNAADVCIVPSYYEPFGIVPLEAMASKTPVIASATGGLQYSVLNSETGLTAIPRDPFDLANKISLIFTEDALRARMVENAFIRVKKEFSWKLIAKKIDAVLQQLIKEYKK